MGPATCACFPVPQTCRRSTVPGNIQWPSLHTPPLPRFNPWFLAGTGPVPLSPPPPAPKSRTLRQKNRSPPPNHVSPGAERTHRKAPCVVASLLRIPPPCRRRGQVKGTAAEALAHRRGAKHPLRPFSILPRRRGGVVETKNRPRLHLCCEPRHRLERRRGKGFRSLVGETPRIQVPRWGEVSDRFPFSPTD